MAKKHRTTIEINGRRYDAVTGAIVHDPAVSPVRPIDDVIRVAGHGSYAMSLAKPKSSLANSVSTPATARPQPKITPKTQAKAIDVQRSTHHAKAHQPERGKTLMRQAVSKPRPSGKRQLRPVTRTDVLAKLPQVTVAPKWSIASINPQRLKHAEHVAKSQLISKFAPMERAFTGQATLAIPAPPTVTHPSRHQAVVSSQPLGYNTRSMDIFQRALTHANAHEQPPVNPKKLARTSHTKPKQRSAFHRRTATLATTALAVVLLTGFIAYQNKANLTLRVASATAGFHATLPGYKPSGFAIGKFNYSPGVVAVNFHNNASNSSYSLTQKSSNWDSQTLLDSYVATKSHAYQTLQSAGRTIYVYGNNNAAWVNNGVLYQVSSDGSLSTSDVLDIATSM